MFLRDRRKQEQSQGNGGETRKGAMSKEDMDKVHRKVRSIQKGDWRFPWFGGGVELFSLMKPGEDDIEGKFFNFLASLNIYYGLLVSGLIGYVLQPDMEMEGENELTGRSMLELSSWQMFLSHINLVCSAVMFAFTMWMCVFVTLETPQTISRCVAKGCGLWLYILTSFLQMILLVGQCCLAAIISLDAEWGKIVVCCDIGIFVVLLFFSQNLLLGPNGMFPVVGMDWLICTPGNLLNYLLFGRDVPRRISEILVADAGHLDFELEGSRTPSQVQAVDAQVHEDAKQLRHFIKSAVRGWEDEKLVFIADAMLKEGLTVDRLVSMASMPSGPMVLFQSLDLETVEINRGERFDLIAAAVNHQVPSAPTSGSSTKL